MITIKQLIKELEDHKEMARRAYRLGWISMAQYYKDLAINKAKQIRARRKTAKLRQKWTLRANGKQYQRDPIINLCEEV